MATTLPPQAPTHDRQSAATMDVGAVELELLERTARLASELPRGARPVELRRLGADITRRGNPTIQRWLRLALGAIAAGQDARLYGEMIADVLGAAAATVLPVPEASLAETVAECLANPLQEVATRPDATVEQERAAVRALDEEARAAERLAASLRRDVRLKLRGAAA